MVTKTPITGQGKAKRKGGGGQAGHAELPEKSRTFAYLQFHDVTTGRSPHQASPHILCLLVQGTDVPGILVVIYHLKGKIQGKTETILEEPRERILLIEERRGKEVICGGCDR